jgi:aminomethyltransferase
MEEPLRRTPLYEWHRSAGARLQPFAGWEMPIQYAGVIAEHRCVRDAAGLFDVSHMGEIAVLGDGATSFLDRLTPNWVARLEPGQAQYSALLTEQGTFRDDLLVYRLEAEQFLLVVNAANTATDLAWLESLRPAGVSIEDRSGVTALLALQGPLAPTLLAALTDLPLDSLRSYRFARGAVAAAATLISRTGYTGEDGFELYLAWQDANSVWEALLEAGKGSGLMPCGLAARDTLRLEAGLLLCGQDMNDATTPIEVGLDWIVKLEKGDFVGSQALRAQRERGIASQLVGFEVAGGGIARSGHSVLLAGEVVGRVTSGTYAPTLEKAIGLALLSRVAPPGTEIEVEVRGKRLPAKIVRRPFYRRARAA